MNKTEKMVSTIKRACACVLGVFAFTAGAATVTEVKTVTHYPWSGKVDVTYTVKGVEPGSAYALQAVVSAGGKEYTNDKWNRVVTADGTYTNAFTWDAGSVTNVNWRDENAQVRITLDEPEYTVVKLTDEDPNEPKWSVSYRCAKKVDLDDNTYRTDRLLLKRVVVSRAGKEYVNHFGVFEVTQGQYKHVMGEGVNPSYFTENENRLVEDMRPVECISYEALKTQQGNFFEKLNTKTGLKLDLPQVVDWEAAAYGNMPDKKTGKRIADYNVNADPTDTPYHTLKNTTADFEWLPKMGRYVDLWNGTTRTKNGNANANRYSDDSKGTAIVGKYAPNDLGLYDMHGNVSEWTLNTDGEDQHILCGGNWQSAAEKCAIGEASRWWYKDADKSQLYKAGFRVFGNAAAVPFPTVSEKSAGFIVDCAVGNVRKVDVRAVGTKYEYAYLDRDGKPYGVAWDDFVAEWDPAWKGDRGWVPTKAGENKVQFNDKDLWATFDANMPEGGAVITVVPASMNCTYDSFPHSISCVTAIAGAVLEYKTEDTAWSRTNPKFTDVKRLGGNLTGKVEAYTIQYRLVEPFFENVPHETTLTINPLGINPAVIHLEKAKFTYNGKQQTAKIDYVKLTVDGGDQGTRELELVSGKDYNIKNGTNVGTEAGAYSVVILGIGNFTGNTANPTGNTSGDWKILPETKEDSVTFNTNSPLPYNGKIQTCSVTVRTKDGVPLSRKVEGNSAQNAGQYKMKVTVTDPNYDIVKYIDWAINPLDISKAKINPAKSLTYNGKEQTNTVGSVVFKGVHEVVMDSQDLACLVLEGNTGTNRGHYDATVRVNTDVCTNFCGMGMMPWEIKPCQVTTDDVSVDTNRYDRVYDGTEKKPEIIFHAPATENDFMPGYVYNNNINAGEEASVTVTATGTGNYTGSVTNYFKIEQAEIAKLTLKEPTSFVYDQTEKSVEVDKVTTKNGYELKDYEYTVNPAELKGTAKGTYRVTAVSASTNIKGSGEAEWTIGTCDIGKATIKQVNVPTYNGDDFEPEFSVTYQGIDLTDGVDYEAESKAASAAGTNYTATIRGKGNYSGSTTVQWKIARCNLDETKFARNALGDAFLPADTNLTYNGEKQVPDFAVTYHGGKNLLVLGKDKDYTVEEPEDAVNSNNESNKTVKIIAVEGGNYAGTNSFDYVIRRLSIADGKQNEISFEYDGTAKTACPTVTVEVAVQKGAATTNLIATAANGGLEEGCRSGTLTESTNGVYTAEVAGAGNFTNTFNVSWSIVQRSITNATVTLEYEKTTYTGDPCEPKVTVKDLGGKDVPAAQYEVHYSNNVNAGTGCVEVVAKNDYKGKVTKYFTIERKNVADKDVTVTAQTYTYNGEEKRGLLSSAKYNEKNLTDKKDYLLSDNVQTNAGNHVLTMKGLGNYCGSSEVDWTIEQCSIENNSSFSDMKNKSYNGEKQYAEGTVSVRVKDNDGNWKNLTLEPDTDYVFTGETSGTGVKVYSVKAEGTGNFKGTTSKSATWEITPLSIEGAEITFKGDDSFPYDKKDHFVEIDTVKVGEFTLKEKTDYTATGLGPENQAKTSTVVVRGQGNFGGEAKKDWYITPLSLENAEVQFKNDWQEHTGSDIEVGIESIKIGKVDVTSDCKWKKDDLRKSEVGWHKVKIEPATANVSNETTATWHIVPQPPRFSPPGTNVLEKYTVFTDPNQTLTFSQYEGWNYPKDTKIHWSTNGSDFAAYRRQRIRINTVAGDAATTARAFNVISKEGEADLVSRTNETTYVRGICPDVEVKLDKDTKDPYGNPVNGTNYYNSASKIVINRLGTVGGQTKRKDPMTGEMVSVFPPSYDPANPDGEIRYTLVVDGNTNCVDVVYTNDVKICVTGLVMKITAYVKGDKYQSGAVTNSVFSRYVKPLATPAITVITNSYLDMKSNPALSNRSVRISVDTNGLNAVDVERLRVYYTTARSQGQQPAVAEDPMGPEQGKAVVGDIYVPYGSAKTPDLQFNVGLYENLAIKAVAYLDYDGDNDYYGKSTNIANMVTSRGWTINDALDCPGLEFVTGTNDTPWVHQEAGYDNYPTNDDPDRWVARDELQEEDFVDCMRSGAISIPQKMESIEDRTNSTLSAILHGPGCLKFNWMASCDDSTGYYDLHRGEFLVDGVVANVIDGLSGWTNVEFEVTGKGDHVVSWRYTKDYYDWDMGDDCIWLDQVKWTPSPLLDTNNAAIAIQELTYTATNMWPAVTITCLTTNAPHFAEGDQLVEGEDYTLKFFDAEGNDVTADGIKAAGEGYKVVAIGCEEKWSGEWTNEWSIAKRTLSNENTTIALTPGTYVFTNGLYNVTNDSVVVTVKDVVGAITTANGEYAYSGDIEKTNVGTYTLNVDGIGNNFEGRASTNWFITGLPIEGAVVTLQEKEFTYNGNEKTAQVSKVVVNGIDITDLYPEVWAVDETTNKRTDADAYTLVITGCVNCTGSATADWKIAKCPMSLVKEAEIAWDKTPLTYTGKSQKPEVWQFTYEGHTYTNKVDGEFTVVYDEDTTSAADDLTITLRATEKNFTGDSQKISYAIAQKDIADADVTLEMKQTEFEYDGTEHVCEPETFAYNGMNLRWPDDFKASGNVYTDAGDYICRFEGVVNYKGNRSVDWKITKCPMSKTTVTLAETSYTYDGTPKKPEVTSVTYKGKDVAYTKSYEDNPVNPGKHYVTIISDDKNFDGSTQAEYTIGKLDFSDKLTVELGDAPVYTAGDAALTQEVVKVTCTTGTVTLVLTEGTDYTVVSNNVYKDAGLFYLTIAAKPDGNYTGTTNVLYQILPADIDGATVTLTNETYVYDGQLKTPEVCLTFNGKEIASNACVTATGDEIAGWDESGDVSATNAKDPYTIVLRGKYDATKVAAEFPNVVYTGNFSNEVKKTWAITPRGITNATVKVVFTGTDTNAVIFSGAEQHPVTVTVTDGTMLTGNDWSWEITDPANKDMTNAGVKTITVTGTNNYEGVTSVTVEILKQEMCHVTVDPAEVDLVWNGTVQTRGITNVTYNGYTLIPGIDYMVTNQTAMNAGKYQMFIRAANTSTNFVCVKTNPNTDKVIDWAIKPCRPTFQVSTRDTETGVEETRTLGPDEDVVVYYSTEVKYGRVVVTLSVPEEVRKLQNGWTLYYKIDGGETKQYDPSGVEAGAKFVIENNKAVVEAWAVTDDGVEGKHRTVKFFCDQLVAPSIYLMADLDNPDAKTKGAISAAVDKVDQPLTNFFHKTQTVVLTPFAMMEQPEIDVATNGTHKSAYDWTANDARYWIYVDGEEVVSSNKYEGAFNIGEYADGKSATNILVVAKVFSGTKDQDSAWTSNVFQRLRGKFVEPTMELTGGAFDGDTFYHAGQPVTIAFTNAMPTCSNKTHTAIGTIRYTLDGGATNTLESGKTFLITNTTTVVAWVEEEDHDPSDKVTNNFVRAMEKLAPIEMTYVLNGETVDKFVHTGTAMAFTNDLRQIAERTAVAWPTNTTVSPASPFTLTNDAGVVTVVASCADYLPVTNAIRYGRELAPVATPVVTLTEVAGDKGSVNVEITCATAGANIYYTVDGTDPVGPGEYGAARNGKLYAGVCTEPLPLYSATTTMVVKAIAYTSCVEHVDCFVGRSAIGKGEFTRHWDIGDVLGDPNQKFYMGDKRIGLVLRDGTVLTEADTNAIWRATSNVYYKGVASMRSGKIGNNEKSTLTTVVEGPGALSFAWKTSCEYDPHYHDFDHVELRIDGIHIDRLDGTNGWDCVTNGWVEVNAHIVDSGRHVIDWIYVKDDTESHGHCPCFEDCAWIADFAWQPCPNISNAVVKLGAPLVYNFQEQTQEIEKVSITFTNKVGVISELVLKPGTDYIVSNNWATDVGDYEMFLTASETNFTGSLKVPFKVYPKDIGEGLVITLDPTTLYYNGYEQTQQVTSVTWNGQPLTRGKHYSLTGDTATLAGTNTLVFTGLEKSFEGTTNINWVIHKRDIGTSKITFTKSPLTYNDKTQTIEVASVVVEGVKDPLEYGTDYTIDAGTDKAKDVGSYSMKITAMGDNFTGTGTAGWTIDPLSITNATVKYEQSAFTYDGTEHVVKIAKITAYHPGGYEVALTNAATGWRIDNTKPNRTDRATDAGWYYAHVEGFGNLTNEVNYKKCLWKINPRTLTGEMVTVDPTSYEPVYTRSAKEPKLVFADTKPATIDVSKDIETPYTYDKNVNAGTGTVTVVAKGNYTGTVVKEFEILKAGFKTVELNTYEQTFTGGELSVSVTKVTTTNEVVGGVKKLEYTERGLTATDIGTYAVVVKPTSPNFTASATTNWVIKPAGIAEGLVVEWATNLTYNAAEQTNAVKSVTWKGIELKPGVDYVVSNNWGTAAGTNEACFAGKGNYSGTTNVAWSIAKLDMGYTNPGKVELVPGPWSLDFTYDGYPKTVEIAEVRVQHPDGYMVTNTFAMGNYELSRDVTRTNAGSYSVTVTGVENMAGSRGSGWTIKAAALTNEMVKLSATNFVYNAEGQSPVVTVTAEAPAEVVEGDDYDVTFLSAGDYTSDITNAGTKVAIVTAKRNWKGAVTNEYVIEKAVLGTLVLNEPTTFDYDGLEKKVTVASVTTTNDVPVTEADYVLTCNVGTNAATYAAQVAAKDGSRNFTGSATADWVIKQRGIENVTITYEDLTYNREVQTPVSNVTDAAAIITEADFTTSVEPAEVKLAGDYTVTVVGQRNYTGTTNVTFKVKQAVIKSFEFNGASKIEYTGKEVTVDARNVKTENGLVLDKTEWAFEDEGTTTYRATNVGSYTAAIKSLDAANIVVKAGGLSKQWSIYAKDISGAEVVVNLEKDVVYAAKPQTIKDGNVKSVTADGVEIKNYTISCDEQKNAGKHTAKVTANDPNFKGTADVEWEIKPRDITGGTVTYVEEPILWTGSELTVQMKDLTVSDAYGTDTFPSTDTTFAYAGDKATEAGAHAAFTATGSDNFKGTATGSWRIKPTKPTIKPGEGGKYSKILPYITVEMTKDDEDWTIEYSVDGGAWTTYVGKFDIVKRCVIKARTISQDGTVKSDVASMEYSFGVSTDPTVALYAASEDDVPTDAEMAGAGQLVWDPAAGGPYTNFYHKNTQVNLTRFGTMTAEEIAKAIEDTTYKVGDVEVCPYTDGAVWYTIDLEGNGIAPTNVEDGVSKRFDPADKTTWPTISTNATLVAKVFGKMLADGNPVTNAFNRIWTQIPAPVITPTAQIFNHTVDVTIAKGAYAGKEKHVAKDTVLYYAINGEVTTSSTKYTGSFKVTRQDAVDGKVVVRALAYIDDDHISGTNEVTYTFVELKLTAPTISLEDVTGEEEVGKKGPNTFTHRAPFVDIAHSDAPDGIPNVGKVYYTTDGSNPTNSTTRRIYLPTGFYLDENIMTNEQVTVMAYVDATGTDYASSDVTTNTFTWCKYSMEKPVVTGGGTPVTADQVFYTDDYAVTIKHATVNTTGDPDDDHVLKGPIYWTDDGTEPTTASKKFDYGSEGVVTNIDDTTTFWALHVGDNQHSNSYTKVTFTRKIPAPKVYLTDLAGNKLYEDDGTTPATNFYHNAKLVMESSAARATIGYESVELGDGTYAGPIAVSNTFTVSATAKRGAYESEATTVTFTRKWETLGAPKILLKNPEGVATNVFRHSGDTVLVSNRFEYVKHTAELWPTNATIKIAMGDEPTADDWFDYVEGMTILTTNNVAVWAAVEAEDYLSCTNNDWFVRNVDALDAPEIDLDNSDSRTNVVVTFTLPEGANTIWYTYAVTNDDAEVELVDPVGEEYDKYSAAHLASKVWTNGSEAVNIAIKPHQQVFVKAVAYFEEDDGVPACTNRCFTGKSAVTNEAISLEWTLADGLDVPDWKTFTVTSSKREGSTAEVVEDDEVKNFGDSSVRFEGVADSQWLSVETTVIGPGTVVFDWKTNCEKGPHDYNYDHMTFYVNGTPICKRDGSNDWQTVTNRINGGMLTKNVLKWVYEKDDSEHGKTADLAWLDHFQWIEGETQLEITDDLDDWAYEYLDEYDYWALYNPDGSPNTTQWKQMLAQKAACNDRTYWECYVLGLDPTDTDAKFVITAPVLNEQIGTASVTFVPRMAGRTYTLVGKKSLNDVYWADLAVINATVTELGKPTTIKTEVGVIASEAHPEWAGYKYFTLRVKMAPTAK